MLLGEELENLWNYPLCSSVNECIHLVSLILDPVLEIDMRLFSHPATYLLNKIILGCVKGMCEKSCPSS